MPDNARRPLVAGNWKMHGLRASAAELARMDAGYGELWRNVDLMLCPPATLLSTLAARRGRHADRDRRPGLPSRSPPAPITGDISAEMLGRCRRRGGDRRPLGAAHRPP